MYDSFFLVDSLTLISLKVELIYIVEILPPVPGKSVMVVEPGWEEFGVEVYTMIYQNLQRYPVHFILKAGDTELQTMKVNSVANYAKFEGLKLEEKYTIREDV